MAVCEEGVCLFVCGGLVYMYCANRLGYATASWLIACFQPLAFDIIEGVGVFVCEALIVKEFH